MSSFSFCNLAISLLKDPGSSVVLISHRDLASSLLASFRECSFIWIGLVTEHGEICQLQADGKDVVLDACCMAFSGPLPKDPAARRFTHDQSRKISGM